jgi:hypothetical protein
MSDMSCKSTRSILPGSLQPCCDVSRKPSKGVGAAACLALVKAGASVVLNYSSDEASANQIVDKIGRGRAF